MNRLLKLAAAMLLAAAFACAQVSGVTCSSATIPVCSKGSPSGLVQIKPQAVPTSSTAVTTSDAYLQTVTVTNTSAGALTFTLADRQGTPVALFSALSLAAATTQTFTFPGFYFCPGGFTVIASGSGLDFYANWQQ